MNLPRTFHFPALVLGATLIYAVPAFAHRVAPYAGVTSVEITIQDQSRTRPVLVLRPTNVDSSTLAPLVIMLTYLNGLPADMANFVSAQKLVRDDGAWVMLPEASDGKWNDGAIGQVKVVDDREFLDHLIDYATTTYPIDPHRIYMTGYSNGSLMTSYFSCEYADKLAAIGLVAGTFRKVVVSGCQPDAPLPVAIIAGTDDPIVPYDGNSYYESIPDSVDFWRQNNGCSASEDSSDLPNLIDDGTTVELDRYQDCTSNDPVDLYKVIGGGHTWPGALDSSAALGNTTQDIDATQTLWQFFQQFPRP